ncbi:NAD-dependent epimerase/dehydratase family protein [Pedobacter miscanthi]|uniref:NAD(P)-dependent oxidoreductase n=1 Tax=Pedobacter miscanthi TaxID=2259170 RepID=A0A366KPF8_9SPHI|nr:NAD(P)-dependent oxidoreductase [Pedobacter miscanthi]RBQ03556.1 NAD(P)-dependent oxidoreductase [Pedobacter miscanthi]
MILLTGASGFIGSHLLSFIKNIDNKEVLALTSKPIDGVRFLLHNDYSFDRFFLTREGVSEIIETIIHVGAFTPKNRNEANVIDKCNRNIYNLEKLLNLELPNLKKIIFLSTLDVYGDADIIDENTQLDPSTLYGYSKLYGEQMVTTFAEVNGIDCQILRIGHVYGPGEDKYEKIIPVTIRKLIANQPVEIWGDGSELRAFIYIDDVVKAIVNSLSMNKKVGPINVVSDYSISVRDLIQNIIEISGQETSIKYVNRNKIAKSLRFDNGKLKKYLLSEQISLKMGLNAEWNYMKKIS